MTSPKLNPFVYIPGSGGGAPDLSALKSNLDDEIAFEIIKYPSWRRCVDPTFNADILVSQLSNEIEARVPSGPLSIIGLSLGGHFAYLVALDLQARGRQIGTVCAIDSFIVNTDQPTQGWQRRALSEFLGFFRELRLSELMQFGRSRFWRAMLRALGSKLPRLLSNVSKVSWLSRALEFDPILKKELDMRMLVRLVAPWLATINTSPSRLSVPVALIRTRSTASSDAAWRARCSHLEVFEVTGLHHTLFEPENIDSLRVAFAAARAVTEPRMHSRIGRDHPYNG